MDQKTATIEVSGANGFVLLGTGVHSVPGLIIAARTLDGGNTISGSQISNNPLAVDYEDYEIDSTGQWDPLWSRDNSITVAAGTVRIALGEK